MEQGPTFESEKVFSEELLSKEVLEKDQTYYLQAIDNVEDVLRSHINYDVLGGIFLELLKKVYPTYSDQDLSKRVNDVLAVPKRVVYVLPGEYAGAANPYEILFSAKALCDDEGNVDYPEVMRIFLHEIMHVFSANMSEDDYEEGSLSVGFKQYGASDAFTHINEGMTEVLSDAIFSEYIARTGDVNQFQEVGEVFSDPKLISRISPSTTSNYLNYIKTLHVFVNKIAVLCSLSEEDVFRALVAEYVQGGSLSREEIIHAFKKYPQVVNYIHHLETDNEMELIKNLPPEAEEFMINDVHFQEQYYAKALFGRDRIAENNILESEKDIQILNKDRYNGLL